LQNVNLPIFRDSPTQLNQTAPSPQSNIRRR